MINGDVPRTPKDILPREIGLKLIVAIFSSGTRNKPNTNHILATVAIVSTAAEEFLGKSYPRDSQGTIRGTACTPEPLKGNNT
jgi:hypothetical protein